MDYEIYGINGIPEEALAERQAKKARTSKASTEGSISTAQEIPAADISAPEPQPAPPVQSQAVPQHFGTQPQVPGMMYGVPPVPGIEFPPMAQPGFPGMMGGPRPGFNPMQPGVSPMQHGGPQLPPPMFGGPGGSNGQLLGRPGGPLPGGYPVAPGSLPVGPPGVPPTPGVPPRHFLPPVPPSSNGIPTNGVPPSPNASGVSRGPVPPLFPAGAGAAQPSENIFV